MCGVAGFGELFGEDALVYWEGKGGVSDGSGGMGWADGKRVRDGLVERLNSPRLSSTIRTLIAFFVAADPRFSCDALLDNIGRVASATAGGGWHLRVLI